MRRSTIRLTQLLCLCASVQAFSTSRLHAQSTLSPARAELHARIGAVATEEGFEPATALALIAIESEFDSTAVGKGGPLGLMQIKLGTAIEVMPGIKRTELFNPETNVRIGLRYLRSLMDRYDGDLETALRAYKGGPRAVDTGKGRDNATNSYIMRFRRAQARYATALALDVG